jgi:hypothetical protein
MSRGLLIGRSDRIRTYDLHTPSVMRYQAALRSVTSGSFQPCQAARTITPGIGGCNCHKVNFDINRRATGEGLLIPQELLL